MTEALPDVLQRIEEELGQGAMLQFAHAFGGQRVNIPRKVRANSPLARELGADLAQKIVDVLGGGADITVPMGPATLMGRAKRRAYQLIAEGKSANAVVREVGLHEVTVRRLRRRLRERDERQDDLFKDK
jgi:hypothetical protein